MQGENERQWKKVNEKTYDISSIKRVTKKFLEVTLRPVKLLFSSINLWTDNK